MSKPDVRAFYNTAALDSLFEQEKFAVPELFQGVGRVVLASDNPIKVQCVKGWVDSFGIMHGQSPLPVLGVKVCRRAGESEPSWDSAMNVSLDKVVALVRQLHGDYGSPALVIGTDTVHFRGDVPMTNLSRQKHLSEVELDAALEDAVAFYSEDGQLPRWDVGVTFSKVGFRVTTGDLFVAQMSRVPEKLIRTFFRENLEWCKRINAVLPVIDYDGFEPYIRAIGRFPLGNVVNPLTGELEAWHEDSMPVMVQRGDPRFTPLREVAKTAILGGTPSQSTMDGVLRYAARKDNTGERVII